MITNGFPESTGLYIAQRENDVVLLKITGMYPTLEVGKCINLTSLITGNVVKEASKELTSNIVLFSSSWKFTKLNDINTNVFPKTSFASDGNLRISTDERLLMRNTYYRMCQSGVSFAKIIRAFVYEYHASMETIMNLINEFDKES